MTIAWGPREENLAAIFNGQKTLIPGMPVTNAETLYTVWDMADGTPSDRLGILHGYMKSDVTR